MEGTKKPLRVLVKGWFNVPHSYAVVNCFQIVHLKKVYGDDIDIYVKEQEYFRPEWEKAKKLVYSQEYNDIIRGLKEWNGHDVDVVYSITYPYDISVEVINGKVIPKCVFYTSEFAWLNEQYFCMYTNGVKYGFAESIDITRHLRANPQIHFTSPSFWSSQGIKQYGIDDSRDTIITHGVDSSVFKMHSTMTVRNKVRDFYKVKPEDILLVSIGAMTQNKGIVLMLEALHELVHIHNHKEFKMLLKGTGDLYQSKGFLEEYLNGLIRSGKMTSAHMKDLLEHHIIFTDKTLSYERINDIYNASDLYVSPYIAEGFNLTTLEALAAGLPVLIPRTGSTKEYMEDLYMHGAEPFITYVKSAVGVAPNGMKQNVISTNDVVATLLSSRDKINQMKQERQVLHKSIRDYIAENYSWTAVAKQLYQYLKDISKSQ